MRRKLFPLLLLLGLGLAQPFSPTYQVTKRGAVTLIGNVLMCPQGVGPLNCDETKWDNGYNTPYGNMIFVDADPSAPTWPLGRGGSSRATLNLPSGAQVLFAGLYWGATYPDPGDLGQFSEISLKRPGDTGYLPVSGSPIVVAAGFYGATFAVGFADVTSLVQGSPSGPSGDYWVGGIYAVTGTEAERMAFWILVVVYEDTSQPWRHMEVVHGSLGLCFGGTLDPAYTFTGFQVGGAGNVQIGVLSMHGESGYSNPYLIGSNFLVNGSPVSNAVNPVSLFFNGTTSLLGAHFTAKYPDFTYHRSVYDADIVQVNVPLGTTSIPVGFEQQFPDCYTIFGLTLQVDIPTFTLHGRVYHDLQPNGAREAGEDWTTGQTVHVKLYQGATFMGSATVGPGPGSFSFPNLPSGSYTLILDDNNTPSDTTPTPPTGWHFIHPGSGSRTVTLLSDVTGQDFGLFRGTKLVGQVFYDDGEGGGNPNNALRETGERGVGGVTLTATDGSNTRTATTDGNGNYLLWIPYGWGNVTLSHPLRPATGRNDGSTSFKVASWADATSPASPGAVVNLGAASSLPQDLTRNFGVVRHSALQPSQSGQTTSPGVVTYPHLFRPGTLGDVTLSLAGAPSFTYQARLDTDCDGTWGPGENFAPLPQSFPVGPTWPREADGSLKACALEVRVLVPAGQPDGRVDMAILEANLAWSNNSSVTEPRSVMDATTVAMGTLRLTKEVRNVTQGTPFAQSAGGKPGEVLEYKITYQNIGSLPISAVVLSDPVPFFAELVEDAYGGTGEVSLLCPSSISPVDVDLGAVSVVSLQLGTHCGPSAFYLYPGQGGYFLYQVRIR